jgi:hypothetical protein
MNVFLEKSPEYKEYYRINDLYKKACLRIRDSVYRLRLYPLTERDEKIKEILENKFQRGMTWQNYGFAWTCYYPYLINDIRENVDREKMILSDKIVPVFKKIKSH